MSFGPGDWGGSVGSALSVGCPIDKNLESKNGDLQEYVSRGKRFWVEVA